MACRIFAKYAGFLFWYETCTQVTGCNWYKQWTRGPETHGDPLSQHSIAYITVNFRHLMFFVSQ